MINKRTANSYCCEDISLIENYDKAVSDTENIWHCHHRRETIENLTSYELIKLDLYYGRPASELVFLTQFDHMSLHNKGKQSRMKGKHHTQESKRKNAIEKVNKLGKNKRIMQFRSKKRIASLILVDFFAEFEGISEVRGKFLKNT